MPALAGYRRSLTEDRTREMQRGEKLLEDAQAKLSSVISDIFGISGRQMLQALVDGQRDPRALAGMARGSMRGKIPVLEEALRGFFTDHHAVLLRIMLDNIDRLGEQAALLDAEVERAMSPFSAQATQLDEITGVGLVAAQELIAEIGVEMSCLPTAVHLVSWTKFCPQTHESAGRKKGKGRGKGNRWLASTLGRIVFSVSKSDTFLGERHRRIARRRGKPRLWSPPETRCSPSSTSFCPTLRPTSTTWAPTTTPPASTKTVVPAAWPASSKP
ncbi:MULTISPECIES: transposase [unclassified Nonomuraea]|uniref:transposase n=1 Tax=unclassified Nonomuraea TaxID=2593643 RepID=UPI0033C9EC2D